MLPDRELQLLTAYVDGELSSRERQAVARLLHESADARKVLKQLQLHAAQLKQLPARTLDSGFSEQVLAAIRSQGRGAANRPVAGTRRLPKWARYAAAASVLFVFAGGVVWLANRQPQGASVVKNKSVVEPQAPRVDHGPLVNRIVEGVVGEFARALPPERPGTRLPYDELAKTQWHEHFVQGMTTQRAVHLDVAVTNQRQAVQRLETVLQNKGIRVVVDPPARTKLAKNPARSAYVIYAENIRPDELAAMLFELGTDERARTSIETLTVSMVNEADQTQLSSLLGIKREELETPPPPPSKTLNKFIPKEGQKGKSEPAAPTTTFANDTRVAMILSNEARGGAVSSEIQYFLSQRRQLQPGALQVIVIVHEA